MYQMSAAEREIRRTLKNDYPTFARKCLKIRTKATDKALRPFVLNKAQLYVHQIAEKQLRETGKVRIIVLKGRQQGMSTYIEGRLYHKTTHLFGVRAFILTHAGEATDNLFEMVERFHEHNNPLVKPLTGAANAKELNFRLLDSGYKVGTAGAANVGRSQTVQFFHGSEVAFWKNAHKHAAGAIETVPGEDGTEIWLESTSDGLTNWFADQWALATSGQSDFIAVFVPWFWQDEYREPVPDDFELSREEQEYATAYGCDDEQMAWRRLKKLKLKEEGLFEKEYPATPEEAFQAAGEGCYIKPVNVMKARKTQVTPGAFVPVILGVDPAAGGGDKTAIIDRQGRRAGAGICELWDESDTMVVAGRVLREAKRMKAKKVCIDVTGGLGKGIYDRLVELGHGKLVEAVSFSSTAIEDDRYINKRAEIWGEMADWFALKAGVQVPDNNTLQKHICAPQWGPGATRYNSSGQLQLEPKDKIKARLKESPDYGDALALTFSAPIEPEANTMPIEDAAADSRAGY